MTYNPEISHHNFIDNNREVSPEAKLTGLMSSVSEKQNLELEQRFGLSKLLDSEGRISSADYGSVYTEQELNEFLATLNKMEQKFSEKNSGHFSDREQWKADKSKSKGNQTELAITCLLYKMLGDRYLVARTNEYDDYTNGADNVLIDKETGVAICAFDEVYDREEERTNAEKKQLKVLEIALAGGTDINFGVVSEEGVLKRGKQENLPIFYLGLNKEELNELLQEMADDPNEKTDLERVVYAKLIKSIAQQFVVLMRQNLPEKVKENLFKFKESFSKVQIPK